jgi:hypothetical protein
MAPRPRRSTSAAIVLSDSEDEAGEQSSTRITPEEGVSTAASPSTAPTSVRGVAKVEEEEEGEQGQAMEVDEVPTPCVDAPYYLYRIVEQALTSSPRRRIE